MLHLDAARVEGRVEEARDVRRVPVDPKVEGPHAHARILHEPQKRRVPGVEPHLADLNMLRRGAVPQDVAEEVPHRMELKGIRVRAALEERHARLARGTLEAFLQVLLEFDPHLAEARRHRVVGAAQANDLRRGLGLWKRLNLTDAWYLAKAEGDQLRRGRYLVEALGHCAECHTPRDATGGLDRSRWMQGAPNPSGKGTIPAINAAELGWSATDIAYYLETGFTPDYDSAGGQMTKVIASISKLPAEDREAIAAYLLAIP